MSPAASTAGLYRTHLTNHAVPHPPNRCVECEEAYLLEGGACAPGPRINCWDFDEDKQRCTECDSECRSGAIFGPGGGGGSAARAPAPACTDRHRGPPLPPPRSRVWPQGQQVHRVRH